MTRKKTETVGSSISSGGRAGFSISGALERIADGDLLRAGQPDDVASRDLLDLLAVQPPLDPQVLALGGLGADHVPGVLLVALPLRARPDNRLAKAVPALQHPAAADPADVVAPGQRADLHAEGRIEVSLRRRHSLDDRLEQGVHALAAVLIQVTDEPALQSRAVQHGEIQLAVVGPQFDEQVEGLVEGPVRVGLGTVDLVDDDDRLEPQLQGPHRDVAGLRHGPLVRVDQQQHRVDHAEHPLDLAGEIGVAGGIDDVDQVVAPLDGAVLGADGDAALPLDVVGVHDPFLNVLVGTKGVGCAED